MRFALGLLVLIFAPFIMGAFQNQPRIPQQLTINGDHWNVYQVAVVEDNKSYLGYADCATKVIEIQRDQTDWAKSDTIVHEFLHAATCDDKGQVHNDKYDNDNDDHQGIYFAAGRIADFIADNPQADQYIEWARGGKK